MDDDEARRRYDEYIGSQPHDGWFHCLTEEQELTGEEVRSIIEELLNLAAAAKARGDKSMCTCEGSWRTPDLPECAHYMKFRLLWFSRQPQAVAFCRQVIDILEDAMEKALDGESSIIDSDEWTPMDDLLMRLPPPVQRK